LPIAIPVGTAVGAKGSIVAVAGALDVDVGAGITVKSAGAKPTAAFWRLAVSPIDMAVISSKTAANARAPKMTHLLKSSRGFINFFP
jgi:hypothetical protein